MTAFFCLAEAAVAVLRAAEPGEKLRLTRAAAGAWAAGRMRELGSAAPPLRPARPARPELKAPRDMPRRRIGRGSAGRMALYHALAHIELNAVDLAWDLIARFPGEGLPRAFYDDWVAVARDEARHFDLLSGRLAALGGAYGDLPAHDGLWQAAEASAHDPLARLAVVPLVLEARGLDVSPGLIQKLAAAGDARGAALLRVIYAEEIGHVAAGKRWFDFLCAKRGLAPAPTWHALVRRHAAGALKPPFNAEARRAAGLPRAFYEDPVRAGPDRA
jgi:uncharacterized ferritin-like protein (DUF455 family)